MHPLGRAAFTAIHELRAQPGHERVEVIQGDDVASDALGAVAGVRELQEAGLEVAAVSGVLTSSPLATAEARQVLDVPVLDTFGMTAADTARDLLPRR